MALHVEGRLLEEAQNGKMVVRLSLLLIFVYACHPHGDNKSFRVMGLTPQGVCIS